MTITSFTTTIKNPTLASTISLTITAKVSTELLEKTMTVPSEENTTTSLFQTTQDGFHKNLYQS